MTLDVIRKLLALAADARGIDNERRNAALKACEMIAREGIELREKVKPNAKKPDAQVEAERQAKAARETWEAWVYADDPVRKARRAYANGYDAIDWSKR
jgi:hypothetical protein